MSASDFEMNQRMFCEERKIPYVPTYANTNLGIALKTRGLQPVNGLRHLPKDYSNGWFLWAGENFEATSEFFSVVHASHVSEIYPEAVRLLGLPPGYRFLTSGDYVDIWFDSTLLDEDDD